MPLTEPVRPAKAAIRLSHLLDAALGESTRFPVDVGELAQAVGRELRLGDEITDVQAANLDSFEGGLFQVEKGRWALLYNESLSSPGRIRFTQAHELGHFLVHRLLQDQFHCSQAEIAGYDAGSRQMEAEADEFASTLLMPMTQFRASVAGQSIDLDVLSSASTKFGVSLTAAALRWIRFTEDSAVLVLSTDGFMNWSVSSDQALKNGAYFKTRGRVVPVPEGSLAVDPERESSRLGEPVLLKTWFENAHPDAVVREMKLQCDNYGYTLSLLHLSNGDKVWAPRDWT
ncbi:MULTISPECIES: ImmA/IrrE family metallo-endopeptidase [Ralstonia]|jgi:Predicted Zn peptidase|uniref:ImmA/IrrE family metallo-endopeptidase n=1 Tax=Ralstonia TaxID=48736 RepID=UPI00040D16B9|nr:ImmA/IrrE family metallo-endopeptidase [Ralstonia pickettii]WKZ88692.1 ImmA/IrrE family metallo-endopeptidase [Ralstonia pickettii]